MDKYPIKNQVGLGASVSIETKENQGSGILTDGIVSEILTSAQSHPHGIKVRLVGGQVGRVKKVNPKNDMRGFADLGRIILPKTEDKHNEFKEFYQYDKSIDKLLHHPEKSGAIGKIRRSVQERLAAAVCSFGNDREGGFVYIGINSKGTISGLERDRILGGFSDYDDAFANHIRDSLGNFIKDRVFLTSKLQMKFRKIQEKTICIIQILPSDRPLYVHTENEKAFFVRGIAPRAEKLDVEEQYQYIKERFPNF